MVGIERSRGRGRGVMGKRKGENKFPWRPSKKFQKNEQVSDSKWKPQREGPRLHKETDENALLPSVVEAASDEEENEDILDDNTTAYNALLQSLKAKGGSFAEVYSKRQREQQGASDSDDGDDLEEVAAEGLNPDEDSRDGAYAAEVQSHDVESLCSAGEKKEPENVGGVGHSAKGEDDIMDHVVSLESEDGSEEEDANEARVFSGGQATSCTDPFKNHLGHRLQVDTEPAQLLKGKEKFQCKIVAAGVPGGSWVSSSSLPFKDEKTLQAYAVKKQLQGSWQRLNSKPSWGDFESKMQCEFFSLCSSYKDILHTRKLAWKEDCQNNQEDLSCMDAYVLHILNHVVKTRDLVTKNNAKVQNIVTASSVSDPPRDQGFTRPKVLVLLPFRSSALKFVNRLLKLAPSVQTANVEHKARFFDEFGVEEDDATQEEASTQEVTKSGKPADFCALFSGNNDDHFRVGIKFTRKSIKLYSEFYSSDIIVASPVGLITKIGEAEAEKGKDIDFLSSIEIAVVDYADVILMQNWSHVVSVFDHLNRIPVQQHGTDFMRIREWYLNGHARHFRQSIVLGSFADAGVNALFHRACFNHAGKVKIRCQFDGVLDRIVLQVRQVYQKIEGSLTDIDDARFDYFAKQMFPRLNNSLQTGTMIYTRSYFDFVRLRNFLKAQSASFCLLGEYTKQSDVSRARSWFYHGKRKILLYTERAHFFHRYKIRGIKDLLFYSLPDHAHFYTELLNLLESTDNPSSTILFSGFDNLQLERIVGSARTKKMLTSPSKLFMFC